jgi:quercetin dioxygenase-like cupin family protein
MRPSIRLAVGLALGLAAAAPLFAQSDHMGEAATAVKWGPAPPFFAPGARFAVMQGDPSASGEYTVRLEMPAGYVIKPHYHPTDENVTVLSGSFAVGMGDTVKTGQASVLGSGGFVSIPAQAHHYAVARRKTVVQVHGMGPFAITYLNPADDPRTVASSRQP